MRVGPPPTRQPPFPRPPGGLHLVELNTQFWEANRPSSTAAGSLHGNEGGSRDDYVASLETESGDSPTVQDISDMLDSADESHSGAS